MRHIWDDNDDVNEALQVAALFILGALHYFI